VFGVMATVTPQIILCGNERLYPAGSFVEAATAAVFSGFNFLLK